MTSTHRKSPVYSTVQRLFSRKFSPVVLTHFHAGRAEAGRYRGHCHTICFEGAESDLLNLGLLERRMIPAKPKRNAYGKDYERDFWHVTRRKGGLLSVNRRLNEGLPRSHVLAEFAAWNWPIVDSPLVARKMLLDNATCVVDTIAKVSTAILREKIDAQIAEQRFAASDRQKLHTMVDRFVVNLRSAVGGAKFESRSRSHLKLVVSR